MKGDELRKDRGEARTAPLLDLYPELEVILERSELLAARLSTSDEQVQEMARHLSDIRALLADLLIASNGSRGGTQDDAIKQLVSRFLAIEGKVKEIRNDRMLQIIRRAEPKRGDAH